MQIKHCVPFLKRVIDDPKKYLGYRSYTPTLGFLGYAQLEKWRKEKFLNLGKPSKKSFRAQLILISFQRSLLQGNPHVQIMLSEFMSWKTTLIGFTKTQDKMCKVIVCYFGTSTKNQYLMVARAQFSDKTTCIYLKIVSIRAAWLWGH